MSPRPRPSSGADDSDQLRCERVRPRLLHRRRFQRFEGYTALAHLRPRPAGCLGYIAKTPLRGVLPAAYLPLCRSLLFQKNPLVVLTPAVVAPGSRTNVSTARRQLTPPGDVGWLRGKGKSPRSRMPCPHAPRSSSPTSPRSAAHPLSLPTNRRAFCAAPVAEGGGFPN
ncbi:hypothetical protein MRX96_050124 [Rhipicephalus microplus]